MGKFKTRLKTIPKDAWIMMACCFLVFIFAMVLTVAVIVALATNNPMFGSNLTDHANTFDILMLVFFLILDILMATTLIYNLFFRPHPKMPPVTKEIVKRSIVEIKSGVDDSLSDILPPLVQDESKSKVKFDKEKIKKNFEKKTSDTAPEKNLSNSPDSEKEDK